MISDRDTNIVYVSGLLRRRYPEVRDALKAALGGNLRSITGTKDIWCRDYMPIQLTQDRFVQFKFAPEYLKDYAHRRTEDGASLLRLRNCVYSDLVVDGGNVVRWGDTVVMTEKVYQENPKIPRPELRQKLQKLLEVSRLVMIPVEPRDICGHSDGVVRFVDHDTVLVNDYSDVEPAYSQRLLAALARHGLDAIPFTYCPTDERGTDPGIPPATGCYINFLQTQDKICVPAFGLAADEKAAIILAELFPQCQVIPVWCPKLALEGGAINCVTWNIKVEARQRKAQ